MQFELSPLTFAVVQVLLWASSGEKVEPNLLPPTMQCMWEASLPGDLTGSSWVSVARP